MNAIDRDDTAQKIKEIREALEKATPGPWGTFDGAEVFPLTGEKAHVTLCNVFGLNGLESEWYKEHEAKANGFLIANAPEWLRFLLSELDRIEKENRKLREELDFWKGQYDRQVERSVFLGEMVERLREERDDLIDGLLVYAEQRIGSDDDGEHARNILREIGVTVE